MLTVDKLGKRYGDRWIFKEISFGIERGQRLAILGHNGSGKSTLLKILAHLIPPTAGTVVYEGDPRLTMGYSALDASLYPQLSPREHLELTADLRGITSDWASLLERVNLLYAADKPAGVLSTGMGTRLKLAMALQARPRLLILDEPGAGLDEAGRGLIKEIIAEQSQVGAVILATNDPLERKEATHELELA